MAPLETQSTLAIASYLVAHSSNGQKAALQQATCSTLQTCYLLEGEGSSSFSSSAWPDPAVNGGPPPRLLTLVLPLLAEIGEAPIPCK